MSNNSIHHNSTNSSKWDEYLKSLRSEKGSPITHMVIIFLNFFFHIIILFPRRRCVI